MRLMILLLLVLVGSAATCQEIEGIADRPNKGCDQHIERRGPLRPSDWPKGGHLYQPGTHLLVLAYDLDGSGKASNIRLVSSDLPPAFSPVVTRPLERTKFKPRIKDQGCRWELTVTTGQVIQQRLD